LLLVQPTSCVLLAAALPFSIPALLAHPPACHLARLPDRSMLLLHPPLPAFACSAGSVYSMLLLDILLYSVLLWYLDKVGTAAACTAGCTVL